MTTPGETPDFDNVAAAAWAQRLQPCRACQRYVRSAETTCPFCGVLLSVADEAYQRLLTHARQCAGQLETSLKTFET